MKFRVGAILAGAAMVVAAASPTYAQGVTVGAKVGVNFANVSLDDADDEFQKSKTGFVAGGFVDVPVAPQFSFAPEVLFSQKGTKFEDGEDSISLNVTQVQVPLLFKANFSGGGSSVRPFVAVGPAFGFTASAKTKSDFGGVETEVDSGDEVETVEFSLVFGGGVKFGNASIEARYDLGLNNMSTDESAESKTRKFSILFGFGWGS
jgi:hypothetical protein